MISLKNISYLNEQGNRENIEDAIYPAPGQATPADKLFLVCDGVGGESKGEEASRIASEGFAAFVKSKPFTGNADADSYLSSAQAYVIGEMQQYIRRFPEAARMSTTLTMAYIIDDKILIAWCGDSRIYHFRDGEVIWRSTDHSLVSMLIQQGEITEEEAEHHPKKNVILRSISAAGAPAAIETKWLTNVQAGDDILLCTDGVLEQMNPDRLKIVLQSPAENKTPLFMSYCKGNTGDNFSLYLLKVKTGVKAGAGYSAPRQQAPAAKKSNALLIIIAILLVVLAAAAVVYFLKTKENTNPPPVNTAPVVVEPPTTKADTANGPDTANHDENTVTPAATVKKNDVKKAEPTGRVATKPQATPTVKPKQSQKPVPVRSGKGASGKLESEKPVEKQNEEQKASSPGSTPATTPPAQKPVQTPGQTPPVVDPVPKPVKPVETKDQGTPKVKNEKLVVT